MFDNEGIWNSPTHSKRVKNSAKIMGNYNKFSLNVQLKFVLKTVHQYGELKLGYKKIPMISLTATFLPMVWSTKNDKEQTLAICQFREK